MGLTINRFKHIKDISNYTHLVIPIHRDSGVSFEAENGITTWADEIDYGIFEDFGWPGSGYNVDGTYQSLLNAIHNSTEYLYNEIQALKNDGTTSIALTRSQYQGAWDPAIITAIVSNGNANETSWSISQKPDTTAWETAGELGAIPPFGISVGSGNPNPVSVSVNNASSIFIGSWQGIAKEVYNAPIRSIQSISILNAHGTSFYGGDYDAAVFKANLELGTMKTYTAVVTATNGEATKTMDITRTVAPQPPTTYEWSIHTDTGLLAKEFLPNDASEVTYRWNSGIYGDHTSFGFTIKNYKTEQATVKCSKNNTGSDIEFYVRCDTTYQDQSIASSKEIKCVLKAQSQQTAYYWYIGQDSPSENSSIVTDNNSPGWRLTGTSLDADYSFNTTDNNIADNPTRAESWYIALPVDTQYHLYDDVGTVVEEDYETLDETVEFNGVIYKIYHVLMEARTFGGITIKK